MSQRNLHGEGQHTEDSALLILHNKDEGSSVFLCCNKTLSSSLKSAPLTDFSECFRLFFGTNIFLFPYLVYLGGTAGAAAVSIPAAYLMFQGAAMQCEAKRVAVDVILPQLERHAKENPLGVTEDDVGLRRHTSISSLVKLSDTLWTYPPSTSVAEGHDDEAALKPKQRPRAPQLVRMMMCMAQFISSCTYTMLFASNIRPLAGDHVLSLPASIAIACGGIFAGLVFTAPRTLPFLSGINNIGLLISTGILIAATVAGGGRGQTDTSNSSGGGGSDGGSSNASSAAESSCWLISRSISDFLLFVPIFVACVAPGVFVIDVETNLSRRHWMTAVRPLDEGAVGITPTGAIVKRFYRVIFVAMVVAFAVLLAFGEFIFSQFTTRTNAVVALSLQPGGFRTALLIDLVVSILACAPLNLDALPQMLDGIHTFNRLGYADAFGGSTATVERVVLRAGVMLCVFGTLMLVPFFDLITSLGGCLGLNAFSFFVPIVFRLQAIRRESGSVASGGEELGWLEAARRVPTIREKLTMCMMLALGTAMLISGVTNVIVLLVQRKT